MKKYILFSLLLGLLFACSNERPRNNNPYLPSYQFSYPINLNLPQFSSLNSNLFPIAFTEPTGINIIIMKVSGTDYRAWNANCPNQAMTACSRMSLSGLNAKCNCEDAFEYNLFTGVSTNGGQYTMVPYRVEVIDASTVRVYN